MSGYYDRQGRPLDLLQWAGLCEDRQYAVLARHEEGGHRVSTVWLGLDHRHLGGGPPIIFETMIFGPEGWGGEYCERYATEAAALAGHDQAVMHLRAEILGGGS